MWALIEQKVNYQLNKYPKIKIIVKRYYQIVMYTFSKKIKCEGNIRRISPNDGYEYFFGYYDKTPWDITERYMLCLRVKEAFKEVAPSKPAEIVIFDTQDNNRMDIIGRTATWNVQQGCMLQWLGPDFKRRIIYNDLRDGKYCSVIYDLAEKREKVISMPVYTVSNDGCTALSLDFSRLHRLRPGYGYSNLPDKTKGTLCPDSTCIWKINLKLGSVIPLAKYTDFYAFETRDEMKNAEHKVNHLMLSPNGRRFMVLHRWYQGQRKYTRLVTINTDGNDWYNLSDDDMVSHCFWKNDNEILAFEHKNDGGNGYYLMKDKSTVYKKLWPSLVSDGHPSYSIKGDVVTDTYPDRARVARVKYIHDSDIKIVAKVFAPFKYDNDTRCDLHPRWNRTGNTICIDSIFEGQRGLYIIKI